MKVVFISQDYTFNPPLAHERAFKYSRYVMEQGRVPLSPVLLFHGVANNSREYEVIIEMCKELILACDEVWEFDMDQPAPQGRKVEREYAQWCCVEVKQLDIPILLDIRDKMPNQEEVRWRELNSRTSPCQNDSEPNSGTSLS